MSSAEFNNRFKPEIAELYQQLSKRYSVSETDFAQALTTIANKYLYKGGSVADSEARSFLTQLNAPDLCFALACAQGDEVAWDEFMRDYRGFLQGVSRTLTSNETAAEELVELAWSELYGLREMAGKRISKFSSYSGRGSLKGWLRAVLFQLSVDRHRRQGRYVQTEEEKDFERLTPPVAPTAEQSSLSQRYQRATHKALGQALSNLDGKLKLMLSYYYYDNLTLKQIGKLFGVHEATASRWLQKAQQDVRLAVEKILKQEHKFNQAQIKECLDYAAESEGVDVRGMLIEAEPPAIDRGS